MPTKNTVRCHFKLLERLQKKTVSTPCHWNAQMSLMEVQSGTSTLEKQLGSFSSGLTYTNYKLISPLRIYLMEMKTCVYTKPIHTWLW